VASFYRDRPLNFAHRGASHQAPENTLAAFRRACELGADGIELDVQLSKDGEMVVIHDFSLEGTTDGEGLVRGKTLDELKELDAGSWFDPAFAGERILTLSEVIDAVDDRLLLNIEVKTKRLRDDELAGAVVDAIEKSHLLDRVVVSSFNPLVARRVKQLNAQIPIGLLYAPWHRFYRREPWQRYLSRFDALHPHHTIADGEYVSWARKRGYRVHVWVANEPKDMWRLVGEGVDLIITGQPSLLSEILQA
jgi:glycerophosphoryl diester phosphodiesterase